MVSFQYPGHGEVLDLGAGLRIIPEISKWEFYD